MAAVIQGRALRPALDPAMRRITGLVCNAQVSEAPPHPALASGTPLLPATGGGCWRELELGRAAADENEDRRSEEEGEGVELVEEGVEDDPLAFMVVGKGPQSPVIEHCISDINT